MEYLYSHFTTRERERKRVCESFLGEIHRWFYDVPVSPEMKSDADDALSEGITFKSVISSLFLYTFASVGGHLFFPDFRRSLSCPPVVWELSHSCFFTTNVKITFQIRRGGGANKRARLKNLARKTNNSVFILRGFVTAILCVYIFYVWQILCWEIHNNNKKKFRNRIYLRA